MTDTDAALRAFDATIADARTADEAFAALQALARTLVGARLFTVMTVDMENEVARRAFTSDPANYPASGTKPIRYDGWFDIVHKERRTFVANTIEDIAAVFPDHALIDSLGCRSVVNLPVVLGGDLVATVNMLDDTGHYTPERVALVERELRLPAKLAVAAARLVGAGLNRN